MIAGLLVMDPSLKIMIVTKENVAVFGFWCLFPVLQVYGILSFLRVY